MIYAKYNPPLTTIRGLAGVSRSQTESKVELIHIYSQPPIYFMAMERPSETLDRHICDFYEAGNVLLVMRLADFVRDFPGVELPAGMRPGEVSSKYPKAGELVPVELALPQSLVANGRARKDYRDDLVKKRPWDEAYNRVMVGA